uniref:Uncharacterized protein n=1 Tax=Anguilla anguilla TaxID=7936 RepID=A0A0E9XDD3_ANGAN
MPMQQSLAVTSLSTINHHKKYFSSLPFFVLFLNFPSWCDGQQCYCEHSPYSCAV